MNRLSRVFGAVLLSSLVFGLTSAQAASKKIEAKKADAKSIVLVHGAFADGTNSWDKVIPLLRAKGYNVIAVQNPLTSLGEDVAAANRAIDNQTGSVVLVGHSWGGVVITQAGLHPKVTELVYVAAFAPDVGQSALDLASGYPTPPGFSKLVVDAKGFATLTLDGMTNDFAQDLPAATTDTMFVTQGPTFAGILNEKVTEAAWKTKPSWYVVAENDHMIQPAQQRDSAVKMNATTTSVASSHVPMQSQAQAVADAIIAAAENTADKRD